MVECTALEMRHRCKPIGGSNPSLSASTNSASTNNVRPGDMGNGTYLRHGSQPRAERVVEGLQGFLLQVEVSKIIMHEADEPNAFVDLLDAEFLTGVWIQRERTCCSP